MDTVSRKALIEKIEQESELAGFFPYPRNEGALFMADVIRIWAESIPSTESEGEAVRLRTALERAKLLLSLQNSWGEQTMKAYDIIDQAISPTSETAVQVWYCHKCNQQIPCRHVTLTTAGIKGGRE